MTNSTKPLEMPCVCRSCGGSEGLFALHATTYNPHTLDIMCSICKTVRMGPKHNPQLCIGRDGAYLALDTSGMDMSKDLVDFLRGVRPDQLASYTRALSIICCIRSVTPSMFYRVQNT